MISIDLHMNNVRNFGNILLHKSDVGPGLVDKSAFSKVLLHL
jgi:hypothetical protein